MTDPRNRIARALAMADPMGPDDFDDTTEQEQGIYDRMALASLNNAHLYAVHTVSAPETFRALAEVQGSVTITRSGDQYRTWGETAETGDAQHMVIGTDEVQTVRDIVRSLDAVRVPSDVTDYADWSEVPAVDTGEHITWSNWVR